MKMIDKAIFIAMMLVADAIFEIKKRVIAINDIYEMVLENNYRRDS